MLEPHQTCDLLRGISIYDFCFGQNITDLFLTYKYSQILGFILIVCCTAMNSLDLSILYHIVRGQSVIKLYVIYNMLDVSS
jgi:hypothetical protein